MITSSPGASIAGTLSTFVGPLPGIVPPWDLETALILSILWIPKSFNCLTICVKPLSCANCLIAFNFAWSATGKVPDSRRRIRSFVSACKLDCLGFNFLSKLNSLFASPLILGNLVSTIFLPIGFLAAPPIAGALAGTVADGGTGGGLTCGFTGDGTGGAIPGVLTSPGKAVAAPIPSAGPNTESIVRNSL